MNDAICTVCKTVIRKEKYPSSSEFCSKCGNTLDKAAEQEARQLGHEDYQDWFVSAPAIETYDWITNKIKEMRTTLVKVRR
jgi:predicted amidophosphoribosyltransferase